MRKNYYGYPKGDSAFVGCMAVLYVGVIFGGAVGWVMNIVKVVQMADAGMTNMFILRCVGVLAAPLGAVLGWIK